MRLAEKTIELTYCAQLNEALGQRTIWFGLTQRQEALAGYDAYAQLGGRLIALQFKASDHLLRSGARRFHTAHHQLSALREVGRKRPNSVFYVFPSLGSTVELSRNPDLVGQSQLLDAGQIPSGIGPPTNRHGSLRKSKRHYIDVMPGSATIHSDPVKVRLVGPQQMLEGPSRVVTGHTYVDRIERRLNTDGEQDWFADLMRAASGSCVGAIVLPRAV
jgi:hypothetical protein